MQQTILLKSNYLLPFCKIYHDARFGLAHPGGFAFSCAAFARVAARPHGHAPVRPHVGLARLGGPMHSGRA